MSVDKPLDNPFLIFLPETFQDKFVPAGAFVKEILKERGECLDCHAGPWLRNPERRYNEDVQVRYDDCLEQPLGFGALRSMD
jgi:hypothetical protein